MKMKIQRKRVPLRDYLGSEGLRCRRRVRFVSDCDFLLNNKDTGGTSSDWLLSDDEFIPQNESDIEVPLTSSRRGSSVSSSRSGFATSSTELEEYDSDVSEAPARKSGKKAKKPAKPDLKKSQSNGGSNGGSGRGGTFLTAAEQREREKKSEKKATEDAFDFLKDVRDVSNDACKLRVGYINGLIRKTKTVLVIRATIHGQFMFLAKLGHHSRLSRSRCVFIIFN